MHVLLFPSLVYNVPKWSGTLYGIISSVCIINFEQVI